MIDWFLENWKVHGNICFSVIGGGTHSNIYLSSPCDYLPPWSSHVHTFLSTQQIVSAHHTGHLGRTSTSSQNQWLDRHQSVREIISSRQHLCSVCNYLMKRYSPLAEWTMWSFQVPFYLLTPLLFFLSLWISHYSLSFQLLKNNLRVIRVYNFLMEAWRFFRIKEFQIKSNFNNFFKIHLILLNLQCCIFWVMHNPEHNILLKTCCTSACMFLKEHDFSASGHRERRFD